jgi:hypothetical protein
MDKVRGEGVGPPVSTTAARLDLVGRFRSLEGELTTNSNFYGSRDLDCENVHIKISEFKILKNFVILSL